MYFARQEARGLSVVEVEQFRKARQVLGQVDHLGAGDDVGDAPCKIPELDAQNPFVIVTDDNGKAWRFPNVNGDTNVVCREIATERDLLYAGGVWYEVPAENAGGFAALRPIALADEPVKSLRGEKGLMYLNGTPMVIDDLWANGTASAAYWLWERLRARARGE